MEERDLLYGVGGRRAMMILIMAMVAGVPVASVTTTTTFTIINKCNHTIWPGVLTKPESPKIESTGFELTQGSSRSFQAPPGWSGSFWGRTGCHYNDSGHFSCTTGDCGSGEIQCRGVSATPPVTLAEFTLLFGPGSQEDYYDISLMNGYNLPIVVEGSGSRSRECATISCVMDLNKMCPYELRSTTDHSGIGCKSPCDAFKKADYCCSGPYSSPDTCKPSMYSKVFKSACPHAYAYAYDDTNATHTCSEANYTITFCPIVSRLGNTATGGHPTSGNQTTTRADSFPSKETKHLKLRLMVGLIIAVCALISSLGVIWFISWRNKHNKDNNELSNDEMFGGDHEIESGMGPRKFSFAELAKMTSNFKDDLKLGEGGFGAVYRGQYHKASDTYVAVKRVSKASKQGIKEYIFEVKIISQLRHKNLVKLIGWCHEKRELLLVYEYMANGSLDLHLFKGKSLLTWEMRFKIVHDLASALLYLHEEGDQCVIHRDIKTNNIMLDSNFNAKLGDFGLARLVDHAKGSQTTLLAGTFGYMAPDYISSGKASKESDVYSFGVVALEIACGRRSLEPKYEEESKASLIAWVWDLYGKKRLFDAADHKLNMEFDAKEMECLLMVGLWCVHPDPNSRPSMRQVIQTLKFETTLPNLPNTMPTPSYDHHRVPITSNVRVSEACFSTMTMPLPR